MCRLRRFLLLCQLVGLYENGEKEGGMGGSERTNGLGKGEWWGGEGAGRGAMLDTSPDKIYINITRDQTELFFLKKFFLWIFPSGRMGVLGGVGERL